MIRLVAASLSSNHCPHRIDPIRVGHDVDAWGGSPRFKLLAIFSLVMSQYPARNHV